MRICEKRVSQYTQTDLWLMLKRGTGPDGKLLSESQLKEAKKVYNLRKEREF